MDLRNPKPHRIDSWPSFVDTMLFVDESGNQDIAGIDPIWPCLVIFGTAISRDAYKPLEKNVKDLKSELWPPSGYWAGDGSKPTRVVFHSNDMRRKTGPFGLASMDDEKRRIMDVRLWAAIDSAEWQGVACIIDKAKLMDRYSHPSNPYNLAVDFMMERVCMNCRGSIGIVFEARGQAEDQALWRSIDWTMLYGTGYVSAEEFQNRIKEIGWCPKHDSGGRLLTGLEVSDLAAYNCGAKHLGRTPRFQEFIDKRLFGYPYRVEGRGLKVFPL